MPPSTDMSAFATSLAGFLAALQRCGTAGAPPPGRHNFHRGGDLAVYDGETRAALAALADDLDVARRGDLGAGPRQRLDQPPVWVHGDVSSGNLLIRDGRLAAVIDFGSSAVGDPACDLYIAWTFLDDASRESFRAALPLDAETWARGRGWTLWKALITLAERRDADEARAAVAAILADHRRA